MELKYAEKGSCGAAEGRDKRCLHGPLDIQITLSKVSTPPPSDHTPKHDNPILKTEFMLEKTIRTLGVELD